MKHIARLFLTLALMYGGLEVAHALIPHQCPKLGAAHRCMHRDGSPASFGPKSVGQGCRCITWCFLHGYGLPSEMPPGMPNDNARRKQ